MDYKVQPAPRGFGRNARVKKQLISVKHLQAASRMAQAGFTRYLAHGAVGMLGAWGWHTDTAFLNC
jgi:hypothetical protein